MPQALQLPQSEVHSRGPQLHRPHGGAARRVGIIFEIGSQGLSENRTRYYYYQSFKEDAAEITDYYYA
jgi:hypothetical protein